MRTLLALVLPILYVSGMVMGAEMEDILKKIPDEKLPELRDVFKRDWPSHIHIYNFIDTTIKMKQNPKFENYVNLYAPEGDWSDGSIVGIVQMDSYDVVLYSFDKTLFKLKEALEKTKIIDWSKPVIFPAIKNEFLEILRDLKREISRPFKDEFYTDLWTISKEKALGFSWSISEEYYLAPLNVSHVDATFVERPRKRLNSKEHRARNLEANGGIGLFTKNKNELQAWIIKNYLGAMSSLEVVKGHRRRGLGSLMVQIFAKRLAEEGLDPIANCEISNEVAQHLFERVGFERRYALTWLFDTVN